MAIVAAGWWGVAVDGCKWALDDRDGVFAAGVLASGLLEEGPGVNTGREAGGAGVRTGELGPSLLVIVSAQ